MRKDAVKASKRTDKLQKGGAKPGRVNGHIEKAASKTRKEEGSGRDAKRSKSERKTSNKLPKEEEVASDNINDAAAQAVASDQEGSQSGAEEPESEEEEKPEFAAKARKKVQSTLTSTGKDPYPDWKAGEPVPYAALCTTFSKIELTTKRLEISAHCSLFLRQVLRLTPEDLLPTILLMINKLAADYSGIELGIGESLIMKAIGESTGRSLGVIKADQNEIGDLGLVAAKSRSNQPTMFKPKPLTVRGVHRGLMDIATTEGQGAQARKVAGIKRLLSAADAHLAGKGKGIDITKDKGGPSEAKYIVRTLEGKLRLGLADKTVLVALAQAMVFHEVSKSSNKAPNTEQLANGESILKSVYRWVA
jgi:DNA ligase 1